MKKYIVYVLLGIYAGLFPIILIKLFGPLITNIGIELLFLTLIIINTLTVIKIVLNYIRYGEKMNPFKKVAKPTYNDMIISELSKLNSYQKSLIIDNNLIVINEAGIFEFARINQKGKLKGNIKDDYWYLNNKKINNPFNLKDGVLNYVIINNGLIFEVTGVWLTSRRLLYNTVDKRLNKKIYSKDEIDKIYNKLINDLRLWNVKMCKINSY